MTTATDKTKELTEAEKIWVDIKDKNISLFALKSKPVSEYCYVVSLDPTKCFLVAKASAFLPALESIIGKDYECVQMEKYIVVSRKSNGF